MRFSANCCLPTALHKASEQHTLYSTHMDDPRALSPSLQNVILDATLGAGRVLCAHVTVCYAQTFAGPRTGNFMASGLHEFEANKNDLSQEC